MKNTKLRISNLRSVIRSLPEPLSMELGPCKSRDIVVSEEALAAIKNSAEIQKLILRSDLVVSELDEVKILFAEPKPLRGENRFATAIDEVQDFSPPAIADIAADLQGEAEEAPEEEVIVAEEPVAEEAPVEEPVAEVVVEAPIEPEAPADVVADEPAAEVAPEPEAVTEEPAIVEEAPVEAPAAEEEAPVEPEAEEAPAAEEAAPAKKSKKKTAAAK